MKDIPEYIGRFPIIDTLGVGGMGVVYSAKDPDIGRKVAIKVLHSTGESDDLARFKNEARTMGEISHPNIVILLEYGIDDNKPFLVMEYLSGQSLGKWIKQTHTLQEHIKILMQLCDAITFSHNKDILHRDLKPDNIQVLPSGDAKLLDFGIATGKDKGLTATGCFIGTPKYLAPEILQDTTHTKQSDCYSLGLLAYNMLSGNNPFSAETFEASMAKVLTRTPTSLCKLNPIIPQELSDIVDSYLCKSPKQRPQSPEKLKQSLQLIINADILTKVIDTSKNIKNSQVMEETVVYGAQVRSGNKKIVAITISILILFVLGLLLKPYLLKQKPEPTQSNHNTVLIKKTSDPTIPPVATEKKPEKKPKKSSNKDASIANELPEKKAETVTEPNNKSKDITQKNALQLANKTTVKKPIQAETHEAEKERLKPNKIIVQDSINNSQSKPVETIEQPKQVTVETAIDVKKKLPLAVKKPQSTPIIQLPSFNQVNKKIPLTTQSDTRISRGRTQSIIVDMPEGIKLDKFKLMRGLNEFNQVEIKSSKRLNEKQIQINLYAQSNATMGDFSLIGFHNNKKTKSILLEVTL